MPFEDYTQLVEPLTLPIAGKSYAIRPVSALDGLRYVAARKPGASAALTDREVFDIFLGDTFQQMLDDGVPAEALGRALFTAMADFERGRPTAEVVWATGLDPKAITELTAQMTSTSTGAASTTKRQASGPTTKSRKK